MIFDTHAHYDDKQFDQDREELLVSMKDNGIGTIVDVGSNMEFLRSERSGLIITGMNQNVRFRKNGLKHRLSLPGK